MTKPKKWAYLQELRKHLAQLGYPQHIIERKIQENPWSLQFRRMVRSGTKPEKRV